MRITLKRSKNYEFAIFKILWLLIILPKSLQLVILLAMLFSIIYRTKKIIKTNPYIKLGLIIQAIAVANQILIKGFDASRIAASINTILIWLIALEFYSIAKSKKYSYEDYKELNRIIVFDLVIFCFVFFASLVYKNPKILHFLGREISLRRVDFMSGSTGTRFVGLMETPLGPSHLFLILIPLVIALRSINVNTHALVPIVFISFAAVISSNSRIGMLACAISFACFIVFLLNKKAVKRSYIVLTIITFILIAIFFAIANYNKIVNEFIQFFTSREGSNEARFQIYIESLKLVQNQTYLTPFIGIGIKYMYNDFIPLGSHSTYIGLLYKVGIVGTFFFAIGLIKIGKALYKNCKNSNFGIFIFIPFICYLIFLIFADIDAMDWEIVLLFTSWGILTSFRYNCQKGSRNKSVSL